MRTVVILALWLATTAGVWAQWPTNWPANDFDGRRRAMCVYSALVERALAANVSTNGLNPPGMFTQRRRLVEYKSFISATLATNYVNAMITNAAGEYYQLSNSTPVMWSVTGVLSEAGVSTNYLSSTPMFNLGSDTNLGWFPMRSVVNKLQWTTKPAQANIGRSMAQFVDGLADPILSCNAEINQQTGWPSLSGIGYSASGDTRTMFAFVRAYHGGSLALGERMGAAVESNTNIYNGIAHVAVINGYIAAHQDGAYSNLDNRAIQQSVYTQVFSFAVSTTNYHRMATNDVWGLSDMKTNDANNPIVLAGLNTTDCGPREYGMKIEPFAWILKWNVTNGFKYVP